MTENLCNISIAKPYTAKMAEWINVYLWTGRFLFQFSSQVKPKTLILVFTVTLIDVQT